MDSGAPGEAGTSDAAATSAEATHRTPAYRRALWVVVGLNLGYGIIEGVGGYLAGSQALKADALDFVGDGLITFTSWEIMRRAR